MIFDKRTLELLESFQTKSWNDVAFRHMFNKFPPSRENRRGARWNPADTPAIYTSLERETALAEADYQVRMQPYPPSTPRSLYRLSITLERVIDLSTWDILRHFGLEKDSFASTDYVCSQMIGGSAERLGNDGILVPSARIDGINLVVFPNKRSSTHKFEVLECEEFPPYSQ